MTNTMQVEAIERLREWIKPGDTIHTILRHVSSSGMSRRISLLHISNGDHLEPGGGKPIIRTLDYNVGLALELRQHRDREGLMIRGCGMDMGYAIVYDLARTLFADGFECIGPRCPANDHVNGDRDYSPHMHSDPGYALRHRWL